MSVIHVVPDDRSVTKLGQLSPCVNYNVTLWGKLVETIERGEALHHMTFLTQHCGSKEITKAKEAVTNNSSTNERSRPSAVTNDIKIQFIGSTSIVCIRA